MSSAYPTLSRYSDNLETLFWTLIANINADEEISKLRSTMSKLSRGPGIPLQVPLYKLKSYYELLVGINFPQMDPADVTNRSESYSSNCTKFFVSKNTRIAFDSFIQMKMQKGEKINLMSICQVVGRHEANNPADQLQSVMFLPEHATRLDTQLSSASNIEELFINSTRIDRGRSSQGSKSPAYSRNNGNSRPNNGFKRNSDYTSPGGRAYYRRKSQSPNTRQYGGGSGHNDSRSGTPRPSSGRRPQSSFRSPNGHSYVRSPGRNTFRRYSKSPNSRQQPYTQDNRGRQSKNPTSDSSSKCMRCGGAHNSSFCPKYTWWDGPPCQQCGLMHETRLHRARSVTPAPKAPQPGYRKIQNYESEVIPENFVSSENPTNYFEKN